jgi:ferric-dicitrate binding protein FerR (iron transport regulator)
MNRYSRKTIVLTAPDLGREVVSGAFDTSNIDGFISAVSELHGLRAEVANGEILLARQKP